MLNSFKKWLTEKKYTLTQEKLIGILQEIENEVRKELIEEYSSKFKELQDKIASQSAYISKVEKDFSKVQIDYDILKGKMITKEEEDKKAMEESNKVIANSELGIEIFGAAGK
jgi:uncharacterized protein YhaN